jgi:hypothetical protein
MMLPKIRMHRMLGAFSTKLSKGRATFNIATVIPNTTWLNLLQRSSSHCARRPSATDEQLNAELKDYVPQINAWSRRQRKLFKLTIEMMSANRVTMQ